MPPRKEEADGAHLYSGLESGPDIKKRKAGILFTEALTKTPRRLYSALFHLLFQRRNRERVPCGCFKVCSGATEWGVRLIDRCMMTLYRGHEDINDVQNMVAVYCCHTTIIYNLLMPKLNAFSNKFDCFCRHLAHHRKLPIVYCSAKRINRAYRLQSLLHSCIFVFHIN
jgi:hypothetical protein